MHLDVFTFEGHWRLRRYITLRGYLRIRLSTRVERNVGLTGICVYVLF